MSPLFADKATVAERLAGQKEHQLTLDVRVRHEATHDLVLGGALECAWRQLTGQPPAGWGPSEPVSLRWDREELTSLAQRRAPEQSWFIAVGDGARPALAQQTVRRTTEGVEEEFSLSLGFTEDEELPLSQLPQLADLLATDHGLVMLLAQRRSARADLVVPPQLEHPPLPVGFALGSEDVANAGLALARRPPLPQSPLTIGSPSLPGFYYPLTEAGWEGLRVLMEHLRSAECVEAEEA